MRKNPKDMEWIVLCSRCSRNEIGPYNIFCHASFVKFVEKYLKKENDKAVFAAALRRELTYHYWSKCEWEVILAKIDGRILIFPWIGSAKDQPLDVTDRQDFDWNGFYSAMEKKFMKYENGIKIDVYEQVMFRWEEFLDYVWNSWHGL